MCAILRDKNRIANVDGSGLELMKTNHHEYRG